MNEEELEKLLDEMYDDFADVLVPSDQELEELHERNRKQDELDKIQSEKDDGARDN